MIQKNCYSPAEGERERRLRLCSISQACRYLGISQPTFRKLVKQGELPQGRKIAGIRERIWNKENIEEYARKNGK
ncbi:MAG: helix-turn-helix domain-containing protein [Bacteroidales bacterium]|nr:helix-turn-helix domain-containing protein [Bacteroidales bacterium]